MSRDYNVCEENADGKHRLDKDYALAADATGGGRIVVDVMCADCGTTTGVVIGPADTLEWN